MRKRDRSTLRKFFADGALPSAEQYSDLVESMVNRIDDGFDKPFDDGLKLTSIGRDTPLISFYRGTGSVEPVWSMRHGRADGEMHFERGPDAPADEEEASTPNGPATPALALSARNRVGINRADPKWPLDVKGAVRMTGRIGEASGPVESVPATGDWVDITPRLSGCHAFEVVAGVSGPVNHGRYSLLHAIALSAYNPGNPILNWLFRRRSINAQHAVYGSFADRIRLRWRGSSYDYALQLKSNANLGASFKVQYYVTRLWFDPTMEGSRDPDTEARP